MSTANTAREQAENLILELLEVFRGIPSIYSDTSRVSNEIKRMIDRYNGAVLPAEWSDMLYAVVAWIDDRLCESERIQNWENNRLERHYFGQGPTLQGRHYTEFPKRALRAIDAGQRDVVSIYYLVTQLGYLGCYRTENIEDRRRKFAEDPDRVLCDRIPSHRDDWMRMLYVACAISGDEHRSWQISRTAGQEEPRFLWKRRTAFALTVFFFLGVLNVWVYLSRLLR